MPATTSTTSFTTTELNTPYPNAIIPDSSADRTNGILNKSAVTTVITSLENSGELPKNTLPPGTYHDKINAFMNKIKAEYSYYYTRYQYALQQLFTEVRKSYITSNSNHTTVQTYLQFAIQFNTKLNDCIQITKGISDKINKNTTTMNASLATFSKDMNELQTKLDEQRKIITSTKVTTKLKKEMVNYTEEKARYNDNLLKVYYFLDIVALGLLFYIYRAADE
jgi:hypothetical protein